MRVLATFEAEIIILPLATGIEMKNGVASENKNMHLKINIFISTVFINQASTWLNSGQCWHYTETSPMH